MTLIHDEKGYGWFPYGTVPYGSGAMTATGGFQLELLRDFAEYGFQFEVRKAVPFGFQFRVVPYNIKKLRVLCEFPSRGRAATTGGNNAWGNPDGGGENWLASSTEPSSTDSFDVQNLNTDFVEQHWRSATGVLTATLDCDTEVTGIFVDTMGMLETNLTTSAVVKFQASDTSNFASIEFEATIAPQLDGDNCYIAPELPVQDYRYWRFDIADPTNPDNFLKVGTIVFGAATVLSTQCIVSRVEREDVNYTDTVFTEGQSGVQNDRGIKSKVRMGFKSWEFSSSDYAAMQDVFTTARTVLKCLWIPTPEFPKRFMIFGKMNRIPKQIHNALSEQADYVDFSVEVDEAK
jgi:hypothetical protein